MTFARNKLTLFGRLAFLVLFLVAVCMGAAWYTVQWTRSSAIEVDTGPMAHSWLHGELNFSETERIEMEVMENVYQEDRSQVLDDFNVKIGHLAELLRTEDDLTPAVQEAIHQVHQAHGQLQELSITHYFDMLKILPPEKREKLRNLAARALSQPE